MARIVYIKESKVRGYVTLGVESDGERAAFTVSKPIYSEIGSPVRGTELDNDVMSRLGDEDVRFRAERRALSILSYGDNSRRALGAKLRRAGFSREAAECAVRECEGLGYINEERQLEVKILSLANVKLEGVHKIRARLLRAGYGLSSVNAVLDRLVGAGEVDFRENFERLAERFGADGDEARRELLYKYGYRR